MIRYVCHKWDGCNVQWKDANWLWSECQLVTEIVTGIDATQLIPSWLTENVQHNPYQQKKKDQFIELLFKIKNGPDFNEKKKKREDIKITVKDIKLVLRTVKGIDIKILKE